MNFFQMNAALKELDFPAIYSLISTNFFLLAG